MNDKILSSRMKFQSRAGLWGFGELVAEINGLSQLTNDIAKVGDVTKSAT